MSNLYALHFDKSKIVSPIFGSYQKLSYHQSYEDYMREAKIITAPCDSDCIVCKFLEHTDKDTPKTVYKETRYLGPAYIHGLNEIKVLNLSSGKYNAINAGGTQFKLVYDKHHHSNFKFTSFKNTGKRGYRFTNDEIEEGKQMVIEEKQLIENEYTTQRRLLESIANEEDIRMFLRHHKLDAFLKDS